MSGNGFFQKSLEIIRLRGHPRFYKFVAKYIGTLELGENQMRKLNDIGAKVGLDSSEVQAAIAGSSKGDPSTFPTWLKYLLIIIITAIAIAAGLWAAYQLTYPPGTLYDALAPQDFE